MLVGVTGNFCSGKSAVMRVMKRLGFGVFYSDEIVNGLYKEGEVVKKIGEMFGSTVTLEGKADKTLLASIVFNDPEKLKALNALVHPFVKKRISEIKHEGKIVFVEVPLLFEAGFEELFGKIILVKCSHETIQKRALMKGFTETRAIQVLSTQIAPEKVLDKADFVIDTEVKITNTREKAEEIAGQIANEAGFDDSDGDMN